MPMFEELRAEFARFDALAVGEQNSEERKAIVRRLESGVRNQTIALTELARPGALGAGWRKYHQKAL
jgi:hypothetical protein